MTDSRRLPNFLVIGAMKAGTTSLFNYLALHPDVATGATKEIEFFSRDDRWSRGVSWYSEFFTYAGDARAVGECSTGYTKYPQFPDAPARIAETLSDVRLVYVVRDPIERIRSHYEHAVLAGVETRSIDEAVTTTPEYVDISSYARQVHRYLDAFDAARILVASASDLRERRRSTLARIFAFLDVDPNWWTPLYDHEHYVTDSRPDLRATSKRVLSLAPVRTASRVLAPRTRARLARTRLFSRPRVIAERPTISDSLRRELQARLADDVAEFRHLCATTLRAPSIGDGWVVQDED